MSGWERAVSGLAGPVRVLVERLLERRADLGEACEGLVGAYEVLVQTFEAGGILYVCGNGGSFADAVHIKGELGKRFERARPLTDEGVRARMAEAGLAAESIGRLEGGLPVVVLGESQSLRSAYENDQEASLAYAQELNAFAARLGQGVLLGISTSGNAANVVAAAMVAKAYGLGTISFTGPTGGRLAEVATVDWRAPGASTAEIQENMAVLYHALCRMVEVRFFG